ncbi:MAG: hypothetical protein R3E98_02515 [Gemmatimonadota bacterium]
MTARWWLEGGCARIPAGIVSSPLPTRKALLGVRRAPPPREGAEALRIT